MNWYNQKRLAIDKSEFSLPDLMQEVEFYLEQYFGHFFLIIRLTLDTPLKNQNLIYPKQLI